MPLSRRSLFALDFTGRSRSSNAWLRVHRTAMACRFEITLAAVDRAHADAARKALEECDRIDRLVSAAMPTSETARVNRRAGREAVPVSPEWLDLVQACVAIGADTHGTFDVTSSPINRCWARARREGRQPYPGELAAARSGVGLHRLLVVAENGTAKLTSAAAALGFGGVAKGFAVDRMADLLRRRGVVHALVSAGGSSLLAIGGRDKGWQVHVRAAGPGRPVRLRLRDGALGTSGIGEQFTIVDGVHDGRVVDPRTGHQPREVRSCTVCAASATVADALSTAFLVGGPALASAYCEAHPDTLAVLTMNDPESSLRTFGAFRGAALQQ
jgi:thiamine biosynthesis lipoprotein